MDYKVFNWENGDLLGVMKDEGAMYVYRIGGFDCPVLMIPANEG